MTPEQKMQKVVEAVGECWLNNEDIFSDKDMLKATQRGYNPNPSPTDLNELFRLAEKLGWVDIVIGQASDDYYFADLINADCEVMLGNSREEALLNALYEAVS